MKKFFENMDSNDKAFAIVIMAVVTLMTVGIICITVAAIFGVKV